MPLFDQVFQPSRDMLGVAEGSCVMIYHALSIPFLGVQGAPLRPGSPSKGSKGPLGAPVPAMKPSNWRGNRSPLRVKERDLTLPAIHSHVGDFECWENPSRTWQNNNKPPTASDWASDQNRFRSSHRLPEELPELPPQYPQCVPPAFLLMMPLHRTRGLSPKHLATSARSGPARPFLSSRSCDSDWRSHSPSSQERFSDRL